MWGYPVYLVCRLRSGCDEREGDPGKAASGGFGARDGAPEVSASCAITASSGPQWKPRRWWEGKDHITKARYRVPSVLLGQRLRHTTSWQTCVSVGFMGSFKQPRGGLRGTELLALFFLDAHWLMSGQEGTAATLTPPKQTDVKSTLCALL